MGAIFLIPGEKGPVPNYSRSWDKPGLKVKKARSYKYFGLFKNVFLETGWQLSTCVYADFSAGLVFALEFHNAVDQ
jgi:hypothetical protein